LHKDHHDKLCIKSKTTELIDAATLPILRSSTPEASIVMNWLKLKLSPSLLKLQSKKNRLGLLKTAQQGGNKCFVKASLIF
jgi:hypothetical protein